MNAPDPGLYLLCACTLAPFLAGIGMTLFIQRRIREMGLPYAFIPGGSLIKLYLETHTK